MTTSNGDIVKRIKDEEIAYVDIRFTDPRGKMQHVTAISDIVDEDWFDDGWMFDGSSIAGWKSIDAVGHEADASTWAARYMDPFYRREDAVPASATVLEPDTNERVRARPPRSTAKKAEAISEGSSGVGDVSYWGPEAEFFVFDDVRFAVEMNKVGYQVDADRRLTGTPRPSSRCRQHGPPPGH